jgi:2'-5' RNA ligase
VPSAVIIRARLPARLERLRRSSVEDAAAGVPAHVTLLYPFVEPTALDRGVRERVATIAARHRPFDYRQTSMAEWPDTVYVAVAPTRPFIRLQAELQAAFPDHPIYGRGGDFDFVPHVTIAEGPALEARGLRSDVAWGALPRPARATAVEVIAARAGGRWRLVWRIPLGRPARGPVDRMRP